MHELAPHSARRKVALPIRIRGMSAEGKFFDEQTETQILSKTEVMTRLRNLAELDTEVHLTNLKNKLGGTYRTVWVDTRGNEGFHHVGLELLESEGDLWEMDFPALKPDESKAPAPIWLECQRCHERLETAVPEAEEEFLTEGFQVTRHCEQCKASTPWGIPTAVEAASPTPEPADAALAPDASAEPSPVAEETTREDLRGKGRAPIKMLIKVVREKYGTTLEDTCDTINVSRTGVYFQSNQNYDVGETLKVIVPYKEGDLTIPVPARVVRQVQIPGSFHKGVAIHLEKGRS